jgi:DnaA-homolog protein
VRQLPLGVRLTERAVFASFWSDAHPEVVQHLQSGLRPGITWLWGESGVGKSHLLQAVCAAAAGDEQVGYVPLKELASLGPQLLQGLPRLRRLCCDDLQQVVGNPDWERAWFSLVQAVYEQQAILVVAARAAPAELPWILPDLGSRFAASLIFHLAPLNEHDQQSALQHHAQLRGFDLSDAAARWLQRRFPRDMRSLYQLLNTLDEAGFVAQRRLTVPFIRQVLNASATVDSGSF